MLRQETISKVIPSSALSKRSPRPSRSSLQQTGRESVPNSYLQGLFIKMGSTRTNGGEVHLHTDIEACGVTNSVLILYYFFPVVSLISIHCLGTPFAISRSVTALSCFPWTMISCPAVFPGRGFTDVEDAQAFRSSSAKSSASTWKFSNPVTQVTARRPWRVLMVTEICFSSPFLRQP